jgi:hypothetical protein
MHALVAKTDVTSQPSIGHRPCTGTAYDKVVFSASNPDVTVPKLFRSGWSTLETFSSIMSRARVMTNCEALDLLAVRLAKVILCSAASRHHVALALQIMAWHLPDEN